MHYNKRGYKTLRFYIHVYYIKPSCYYYVTVNIPNYLCNSFSLLLTRCDNRIRV